MTIRTQQLGGGSADGDVVIYTVPEAKRALVKYVSFWTAASLDLVVLYWMRPSDSRLRVVSSAQALTAYNSRQVVELYSVGDEGEELHASGSSECIVDVGGVVFDL